MRFAMPIAPAGVRSDGATPGLDAWLLSGVLLLCTGLSTGADAAQNGGPLDEPNLFVITPKQDPGLQTGKVAYLAGTASPDGVWFKLAGLSINQVVQVSLMADNEAEHLRMDLRKFHWASPVRQASTGADGRCSEQFRTQGDLFLTLVSPQEQRPFRLFVWVSDKIDPAMPPVLVPKTPAGQ